MATLTFSLNSTPFTGSKVYTLSDADTQRWLNALKAYLTIKDVDGKIIANPTNAQLLLAWANGVIEDSKRIVRDTEVNQAASQIIDISAN